MNILFESWLEGALDLDGCVMLTFRAHVLPRSCALGQSALSSVETLESCLLA